MDCRERVYRVMKKLYEELNEIREDREKSGLAGAGYVRCIEIESVELYDIGGFDEAYTCDVCNVYLDQGKNYPTRVSVGFKSGSKETSFYDLVACDNECTVELVSAILYWRPSNVFVISK